MKTSETRVRDSQGISLPKLVLKPTTKNLLDPKAGNNSVESHSYDFYLDNENVTPEPLESIEYSRIENEDSSSYALKGKMNFIKEMSNVKSEEYSIDYFLHGSTDAAKSLLEEIFSQHNHNQSRKTIYDSGPDMINQQETIEMGYEIELSEKLIISDGDYEKFSQEKSRYAEIVLGSKTMVECSTQTVNTLMERDDEESQTQSLLSNTSGTQVSVYNLIYEYDKAEEIEQSIEKTQILSTILSDIHIKPHKEPSLNAEAFSISAMIMERTLASNVMGQLQLFLNEEFPRRPSTNNSFDNYKLVLVYECLLEKKINKNSSPRCIDWNMVTNHLLAVGYGKFYYHFQETCGAVAIWSIKNPINPERYYTFNKSVTCLRFFFEKPNFLAIGFFCGNVLIIDISSGPLKIIFDKSVQFAGIDPILDLCWTYRVGIQLSDVTASESLVTCDGNGRVASYSYIHNSFEEKELIQIDKNDSYDDKNDSYNDRNANDSTDVDNKFKLERYQSATRFMEFDDRTYFVGTSSGHINICSYHSFRNKYIKKLKAHFGPILSLECSPHCKTIFLSTGRDCTINVWVGFKLSEPVLTLDCQRQVEKAIWSPVHSTIIASIVGKH
ncbi:dynein axonemal intermediate chain 4-like [Daktulosphaira vitifoliae]|uniref:dynein axonemal intermediate chain 4-like n=1 Tax=Daktulosphaira vitifoliae TaxID=58002 RepID=UPI0021A9E99D|nr:dynein axonemal intermediate chain 4-like [Daktulosphaira vitifoliae]